MLAAAAVVAVVAVVVSRGNGGGNSASDATSTASRAVVGADFHSLVADPTTPGRLFAGGHTSVSMSVDGGKTWHEMSTLRNADAMGWAFTDDAVYVSGHPGLNTSADRAATFDRTNDGLPSTDVHAFGASPSRSTLYAAGPVLGVVASTDKGKTWIPRTQEAGQSFFGRILVDAADDQQLVAADARSGAVASSDGGRTWRRLGGPPLALWVSRSGATVYASGQQAAKSSDGGATWTDLDLPDGASLVEADPSDQNLLYTGVHSGEAVEVWVSRDGGARWARP